MKINRNSKGFTLIELLIVIAIIGILAAIAIPQYVGYTRKTKVGEVVHSMGAVKNALIAYYTEKGTFTLTCADADSINTTVGILPATRYAAYTVGGVDGTGNCVETACGIRATFNATITSDASINGQTITLFTPPTGGTGAFQIWNWGGSISEDYRPKN